MWVGKICIDHQGYHQPTLRVDEFPPHPDPIPPLDGSSQTSIFLFSWLLLWFAATRILLGRQQKRGRVPHFCTHSLSFGAENEEMGAPLQIVGQVREKARRRRWILLFAPSFLLSPDAHFVRRRMRDLSRLLACFPVFVRRPSLPLMTINECAMQKFINLIAICYWKREIYASGARTAGAMESILGVMPPPLPNTQTDNSDTMFWSPRHPASQTLSN